MRDRTQPPDVVQVAARRGEQVVAVVVIVLEDAADEREPVRMQTRGGQADDDVSGPNPRAVDEPVTFDDPDARAREVQLLVAVDPRELRRLAPDEGDACLAADLGCALDQLGDLLQLDAVCGHVVEEDQRVGAGGDHVVDAVRREVGTARAQRTPLSRQHELRPYRVRGRGEQPALVERVQPRERTKPCRAGRLDCGAEALDDRLARGEGDARLRVRLPSARHGSSVCAQAPGERPTGRSTVTP